MEMFRNVLKCASIERVREHQIEEYKGKVNLTRTLARLSKFIGYTKRWLQV